MVDAEEREEDVDGEAHGGGRVGGIVKKWRAKYDNKGKEEYEKCEGKCVKDFLRWVKFIIRCCSVTDL